MKELYDLVEKFNIRAKQDEKLRKEIQDLERKIQINFSDNGSYNFILKNAQVFEIKDNLQNPDIVVSISTDVFNKILNKEMDVLSAYITRKFTVKASLSDKLLISELLK
ncbi:MAG: SCP2 sterol-binding domain-containing protein [Thermoplasmata archaeon]|nr:SCP2 sterol-binding domain-containing protein [Thermoplasmata archaeon]